MVGPSGPTSRPAEPASARTRALLNAGLELKKRIMVFRAAEEDAARAQFGSIGAREGGRGGRE
jgi:hypothetical protein